MKNLYPLFLFVIFFSVKNLNAQITYPFLHTGTVWGQFEGVAAFIDGQWGLIGTTGFYASQGDTIINAQSYIKINASDSLGNPDYFAAAVREDSLGRVWEFDESDNSDKLLYDFTLIAGQTITPYSPSVPSWINCSVLVDSVSTVNILGNERKAIYFNKIPAGGCGTSIDDGHGGPLIWIEGIGSNGGLFFPTGGDVIADAALWLTCYRENGVLAFGDVCNITLAASIPSSANSSFEIFPNPFTTTATITLTNYTVPCNVQLFDELGREAPLQSHAAQQGSHTMLTLDRGTLQRGMYFLSITSKDKREVVKMVAE